MANKQDKSLLKRRKARWGWLFIAPWVLGFAMFFAFPVFESLYFSMNSLKMSPTGFATTWVGLDNYAFMLLRDAKFVPLLTGELIEMAYRVPLVVILSLFIAVLLNQPFRGRGFFRSVFFLPVIITSGVVYVLLQGIINANSLAGTQNAYIFQSQGLAEALVAAGIPGSIVNAVSEVVNRVFSVLMECGVQILLFLSGLQKIPDSTYEASAIEGANAWDNFWRITLPLSLPIMLLNVIYTIIDSFMAYGTENAGNRVMAAIHQTGFGSQFQFGLAASMSWLYMLMITLVLLAAFAVLGRAARKMEA
ncbi:MAG: carbohydrate ABC transporter permease [Christensenellales bacterium]|jgi:ABC-type sugar transport system permease subunit